MSLHIAEMQRTGWPLCVVKQASEKVVMDYFPKADIVSSLLDSRFGAERRLEALNFIGGFTSSEAAIKVRSRKCGIGVSRRSVDRALRTELRALNRAAVLDEPASLLEKRAQAAHDAVAEGYQEGVEDRISAIELDIDTLSRLRRGFHRAVTRGDWSRAARISRVAQQAAQFNYLRD